MLDHISDQTARACLEALVQLRRENDNAAILSFVAGLEDAVDGPMADMMLGMLAQLGKAAGSGSQG
ncbi:hypothetical protein [Puniceibacterium sediminis]|uniref:Uncharacterized protein n=1 Tax=Puniceibacterium sediminis TaxID=1608407 RepID=A0A238WPQ3_9RHOB|nr:hypothetical protein [Puniceibacterium sediminis]SNR48457.1 hypothetical protein SAMN06265370_106222 [Puniceibacterium sediminis]